jgi:integrase
VLSLLRRGWEKLVTSLGWINRGGHEAPRLHDLHHTFAVRRLVRWDADGAEVGHRMLTLSTYMGHAEIFYTYWYLIAVPELMAITAGRFEQFADLGGDDDA